MEPFQVRLLPYSPQLELVALNSPQLVVEFQVSGPPEQSPPLLVQPKPPPLEVQIQQVPLASVPPKLVIHQLGLVLPLEFVVQLVVLPKQVALTQLVVQLLWEVPQLEGPRWVVPKQDPLPLGQLDQLDLRPMLVVHPP